MYEVRMILVILNCLWVGMLVRLCVLDQWQTGNLSRVTAGIRLPPALVTLIWVSRNFILIPLDRITLNEHYSRRSCSSSDICICLRHKAHNILQVFCMIWDTVLYGAIFSCMMRFCREAGSKSTRIINSAQSPVMIFLEFLLCTEFFFPGLPDFTVQRLWQCAPYILLLNCFLRSSFSCVPVYFWDQTAFWSGSLSLSSLCLVSRWKSSTGRHRAASADGASHGVSLSFLFLPPPPQALSLPKSPSSDRNQRRTKSSGALRPVVLLVNWKCPCSPPHIRSLMPPLFSWISSFFHFTLPIPHPSPRMTLPPSSSLSLAF